MFRALVGILQLLVQKRFIFQDILIPGKEKEDLVRIFVERMDKEAQENQTICQIFFLKYLSLS